MLHEIHLHASNDCRDISLSRQVMHGNLQPHRRAGSFTLAQLDVMEVPARMYLFLSFCKFGLQRGRLHLPKSLPKISVPECTKPEVFTSRVVPLWDAYADAGFGSWLRLAP